VLLARHSRRLVGGSAATATRFDTCTGRAGPRIAALDTRRTRAKRHGHMVASKHASWAAARGGNRLSLVPQANSLTTQLDRLANCISVELRFDPGGRLLPATMNDR